jgi:hypothetical protein
MLDAFKSSQTAKVRAGKSDELNGGKFKLQTAKRIGKDVAKGVSKAALKKGLPKLGQLAAESLGISPNVGKAMGKITGEVISEAVFPKKKGGMTSGGMKSGGGLTADEKAVLEILIDVGENYAQALKRP